MENTYTPQQQFALDVAMILENDKKSYQKIQQRAKEIRKHSNSSASLLSDFIREMVESSVINAINDVDNVGHWLIREVMFGWGVAPYDIIAREILAELELNEPFYTLEKDGAYKIRGTYEDIKQQLEKDGE